MNFLIGRSLVERLKNVVVHLENLGLDDGVSMSGIAREAIEEKVSQLENEFGPIPRRQREPWGRRPPTIT